jgi:uncharacterized protein YjbI with pentapeptide repeats
MFNPANFSERVVTDGTRVVNSCTYEGPSIASTGDYSGRVFNCEAVFKSANRSGSYFSGIEFTSEGSIRFEDTNLTNTKWGNADTSKIEFLGHTDLTGADITLDQLAKAKFVDPHCIFPAGIDFRAIFDRRGELKAGAIVGATPKLIPA